MRIVIDMQGTQAENRNRGIGRYSLAFAQAIVRNCGQHEILLALSGLFPESIEPVRTFFDGLLPQDNIRVWHASGPVSYQDPENDRRRESAELIREAFLENLNPDVIHISSLFEGFDDDAVTSIGRLAQDTPVTVSLYDLIPLVNPEHYLNVNPRFKKHYLAKIDFLKKAAINLSISDFTKQEGLKHLGFNQDKIVNVSAGINPQFRVLSISEDAKFSLLKKYELTRPFILYTGGCDPRKNITGLIVAFSVLPISVRSRHQLLLICAISDNDRAHFHKLAHTLGLGEDELIFPGYVTDEELIQFYNLCKLFIFPSWYEGFGLPALEAMACGAPVIGSNSTSLPEVIGLDEALFNPLAVTEIASKMDQVLRNDVFRCRLASHGAEQAKKFSWDESAKKAIAGWERLKSVISHRSIAIPLKKKPRLAFVSPLPPERSGIADYSNELIPALSEYYEIEVIVQQDRVDKTSFGRGINIRDVAWLRSHAGEVDRILYHVGNSRFHSHMMSLIREFPGTVVLHDLYLGDLLYSQLDQDHIPDTWNRILYEHHGYSALRLNTSDIHSAIRTYPLNGDFLDYAKGLIVHSSISKEQIKKSYRSFCCAGIDVIPLLRIPCGQIDRESARKDLGYKSDEQIVCSFGLLSPSKMNLELVQAWIESKLSYDPKCHLIFVGELPDGEYGLSLMKLIRETNASERIHVTGYLSQERYKQYLKAANIAVQLRSQSRGESSAAVLDCMNYGLPVIVNSHGSMAELDSEAVIHICDEFSPQELIDALENLYQNENHRFALGQRAQNIIRSRHAPDHCAMQYAEAIEKHHSLNISLPLLIEKLVFEENKTMDDDKMISLAKALALNHPRKTGSKSLYLDVTATHSNDLRTGIQRVTRAITLGLLLDPPDGYRVEPVYFSDQGGSWNLRKANKYTLKLLSLDDFNETDEVVEANQGDVFLGLDFSSGITVAADCAGVIDKMRNIGVAVYTIVYDLLPIKIPDAFPDGTDLAHEKWLNVISKYDGAICISKSVAEDFNKWQKSNIYNGKKSRNFRVEWFHLGADIINSHPSKGFPVNYENILATIKKSESFLMVGTIEPRKGYAQVLEAFEILWGKKTKANLIIVGKKGWMIDDLVMKIQSHAELNNQLYWFDGISDELLDLLYGNCTCLIAASHDEGFGLPLIEAAKRKLPILARDIPVFKEVAGDCASYFEAESADELANRIQKWLCDNMSGNIPKSSEMKYLTWKESAKSLINKLPLKI